MTQPAELRPDAPCWKVIGIFGDRRCELLGTHIHCRNCPSYRLAGRQLLERPMPEAYQAELTRRLAGKPEDRQDELLRLMVFRVAGLWLALPSACFEETLPLAAAVRVPLRSNRHFLGLVSAHGELQPCFTLEHFLGADLDDRSAAPVSPRIFPRMMVVNLRAQRWVFPVDEVLGTLEQPRAELELLPANLAKSGQKLLAALFHRDGLHIHLLDGDRLAALFQEALG